MFADESTHFLSAWNLDLDLGGASVIVPIDLEPPPSSPRKTAQRINFLNFGSSFSRYLS